MARKNVADAAKAKAQKQKKIAIGLGVVLALAVAYAAHTMMAMGGGGSQVEKAGESYHFGENNTRTQSRRRGPQTKTCESPQRDRAPCA